MQKHLLLLSLLFLLPHNLWAASVTAIKGNKALINLEGDEVADGDEFFLITEGKKKTAIIRIKQIKNGKAVADILKGHGEVGNTLQARGSSNVGSSAAEAAPVAAAPTSAHESSSPRGKKSAATAAPVATDTSHDMNYQRLLKDAWGVEGEYLMNTMSAQVSSFLDKDTANMKGSSFGAGGFYDHVLTPNISLKMSVLYEQINVAGDVTIPACNGKTSTSCDANITYLGLYGLGKYYVTKDKFRIWAGLGGGFLIAASKSATALDTSSIATNQVWVLSAGSDFQLNRRNFIPFSLSYIYFPPSSTVKAQSISLKVGYAWNL